jgi:uncharacterized protein (DUF885 family)
MAGSVAIVTNPVLPLAEELLQLSFRANPLYPTLLGIPGHGGALADRSQEAEAKVRAGVQDVAARMAAVDPAGLSSDDAVTRAVVLHHAGQMIDELDTRQLEFTISDLFVAPASELIMTLPMITLGTPESQEDYLALLRAVPAYLATAADRHRAGVAAGRIPVASLVHKAVAHLDR